MTLLSETTLKMNNTHKLSIFRKICYPEFCVAVLRGPSLPYIPLNIVGNSKIKIKNKKLNICTRDLCCRVYGIVFLIVAWQHVYIVHRGPGQRCDTIFKLSFRLSWHQIILYCFHHLAFQYLHVVLVECIFNLSDNLIL